MRARLIPALAVALAGAGCAPAEDVYAAPLDATYRGVETRLLDGDLVNFRVAMEGARGPRDVEDYAECAAAQYTLIRGFGFARHLRTNVYEEGGLWRADAIYTISPALPRGLKTIDAEVVSAACTENGIPMV
jgi:hypothetical protein